MLETLQISSIQISEILEGNIEQWESFVPSKLPEGIWNCLPEIQFYENFQQQFYTSIYGLMAGFDMFLKRKVIVDSLQNSQNSFEITLYEKHLSKLATLVQTFQDAIIEVKEKLQCNFAIQKDSPNYLTVEKYLEFVETMVNKNTINETYSPDMEELSNALNSLLNDSLALMNLS